MNGVQFIGRTCHGKECLDLMLFHTNLEVSNYLKYFQELVKSLEVNPMKVVKEEDKYLH